MRAPRLNLVKASIVDLKSETHVFAKNRVSIHTQSEILAVGVAVKKGNVA